MSANSILPVKQPQTHRANQRYDAYQIPPDWKLAQNHGLAALPGHPKQKKNQVCPCCLNFIDKSQISLWEDNKELAFLGEGFPLFYNFMKFCMIMLGALVIDSCAANVYTNLSVNECKISEVVERKLSQSVTQVGATQCGDSFYNRIATITSAPTTGIKIILKIVSFIAQLCILLYFRQQQSTLASYLDERNTTPSDYTLLIDNVPKGLKNYKKIIKEFIGELDSNIQVKQVLIIQDMKQHYILQKKLQQIIKDKKKALKQKKSIEEIIEFDQEYQKTEEQIVKLGEFMERKQDIYFLGTAFVIMNTQKQRNRAIQAINQAKFQTIEHFFPHYDPKSNGAIFAEQANQPLEIDWQNIHFTHRQRVGAIILGWIVFTIILAAITVIFFFIIREKSYLIQHAQQHHLQEPQNQQYINQLKGGVALGYIIVVLINVINKFGLSHIAHAITDHERHIHFSSLQYSFALKYTLSMFFTTALMTVIVQAAVFKNYVKALGVVEQQTFMFIFNALFSPIMWLINPYYLVHYIKMKLYHGHVEFTQKQANHLMQYPHYDMGKRYAQIMKTMWFTFLYVQLVPIGAAFSFIGILIYYVVDKYVLLRRSSVKQSISSDLSKSMVTVLEFTLILKPIGQILFAFQIKGQFQIASLVMLCVGVLYILLPLEKLLHHFFNQQFEPEEKTYDQVKATFIENYFTCYPIRKHQAHLKHLHSNTIIFKSQLSIVKQKKTEKNIKADESLMDLK